MITATDRAPFAHAAAARLAESTAAALLHIKGPARPAQLQRIGHQPTDADVLIRPRDLAAYQHALRAQDWIRLNRFVTGSPFGHAETWSHPLWGQLDLHRFVPGIELPAEEAFTILWRAREPIAIAGYPCWRPREDHHALILLLHAARSGNAREDDIALTWHQRPQAQAEIRAAVQQLRAEVGFAAAVGHLDEFAGRRTYPLWRIVSTGEGSRVQEWAARFRAARSISAKAELVWRAGLVNTDHLRMTTGREPTAPEVAREFVRRLARAFGGRS